MKLKQKRGFTLIELLVVVLIIGILAAIAIPQYQKAVERSRMAEAIQRLGDYATAQQAYYMHHGGFADDYATLNQGDIQVPEQTEVGAWDTGDSRWKITSASGSSLEKIEMSAERTSGIFEGCILTLTVEANGHIEKTCSGNEDCCVAAQNSGYGEGEDSSSEEASGNSANPLSLEGFLNSSVCTTDIYWGSGCVVEPEENRIKRTVCYNNHPSSCHDDYIVLGYDEEGEEVYRNCVDLRDGVCVVENRYNENLQYMGQINCGLPGITECDSQLNTYNEDGSYRTTRQTCTIDNNFNCVEYDPSSGLEYQYFTNEQEMVSSARCQNFSENGCEKWMVNESGGSYYCARWNVNDGSCEERLEEDIPLS